MLSEAEQRRLHEIETLLRVEDPGFAQRFDIPWGASRKWRMVSLVAFAAAVVVTEIALLAGSVVFAVLGLSFVCAAAGRWLSLRAGRRWRIRHHRGNSEGAGDMHRH